jgi:hypothetical protein
MQSAGGRTVNVLTDGTSIFASFASKVQPFLERSRGRALRTFEKQMTNLLITLLTPASMLALVFGLWRVGTDLGWTGNFLIASGLFSHWQVWMALAIALKFAGSSLQARLTAIAQSSAEN